MCLEALSDKTYALQHNPNCPSPYLIRLVGKGAGYIDYRPVGETGDRLFPGHTVQAAVTKALEGAD